MPKTTAYFDGVPTDGQNMSKEGISKEYKISEQFLQEDDNI